MEFDPLTRAVQAVASAEKRLNDDDFAGAQQLLHEARQLCPTLESLNQMEAILQVRKVAAESKGNSANGNDHNWYAILQVESGERIEVIKKKYHKMALLLHPDKNKASGAEIAFKLVNEAYQILSDISKRSFYDIQRQNGLGKDNMAFADGRRKDNGDPMEDKAVPEYFGSFNTFGKQQQYPQHHQQQQRQEKKEHKKCQEETNTMDSDIPRPGFFFTLCPFCRTVFECKIRHKYYNFECLKCFRIFKGYEKNDVLDQRQTGTQEHKRHYQGENLNQGSNNAGNTQGRFGNGMESISSAHGNGNGSGFYYSEPTITDLFIKEFNSALNSPPKNPFLNSRGPRNIDEYSEERYFREHKDWFTHPSSFSQQVLRNDKPKSSPTVPATPIVTFGLSIGAGIAGTSVKTSNFSENPFANSVTGDVFTSTVSSSASANLTSFSSGGAGSAIPSFAVSWMNKANDFIGKVCLRVGKQRMQDGDKENENKIENRKLYMGIEAWRMFMERIKKSKGEEWKINDKPSRKSKWDDDEKSPQSQAKKSRTDIRKTEDENENVVVTGLASAVASSNRNVQNGGDDADDYGCESKMKRARLR